MATVTATLSLASSDVMTSPISLTVNKALTVDSGNLMRAKVAATAVGASALTVYNKEQYNDRAYLYVKNLEETLEDYVYVYNDEDGSASVVQELVGKIGGGEFAFLPLDASVSYAVYATKANSMIEFGTFGNDNSSVSLTVAPNA